MKTRSLIVVLLAALPLIAFARENDSQYKLEALQRRLAFAAASPIVPVPNTHECNFKTSSCNTTFTAVVNVFGCRTDSFLYYNVYRLSVAGNTRVTLSASSSTRRTFLAVFTDPDVQVVGSDLRSAGVTASVTFSNTSSSTRSYLLTVGPGDEFVDGNFNATITCAPISTGLCTPTATTLCLNGNRFAVTTAWKTSSSSGTATAVSMTADTGHFWFFNSANVELVIKILDGRGVNGKWWVFFGALSDVEYTITVRDTQTGATKTYFNPQGRLASISDTSAF